MGVKFIDQIFNAYHTLIAESLFDDFIAGQRNSLFVYFSETSLVDELLDGFSGWWSVSYPWLYSSEHVHSCLVVSDENSVANLEKSEQSHDFFFLRRNLIDTLNSNS